MSAAGHFRPTPLALPPASRLLRPKSDLSLSATGKRTFEEVDSGVLHNSMANQRAMLSTGFQSGKATCVCEVYFDPRRAPKSLFANEPSLSVQGMGGNRGSSG